MGEDLGNLIGDYFVVCANVKSETPTCYLLKTKEVRTMAMYNTNQKGKKSYWLETKSYNQEKFQNWGRLGNPYWCLAYFVLLNHTAYNG